MLLAQDSLLWSGAHSGVDPARVALLLYSVHPSTTVGLGVFVVGHVFGTGIAGSPTLDLIGWSLTCVGLAVVARALRIDESLRARELIPA